MSNSTHNSRKIVIIANEKVGYEFVKKAIQEGNNVVSVFTSDSTRKKYIADFYDFNGLKEKYQSIPFHFIMDPRERSVIDAIEAYEPDIILVISWSQILPKEIVGCPRLGTIGVHYSMLPERRGGAPLTWAIIDGLENLGLTLFYLDGGIDTGDIIDQIELEISTRDTIQSMLRKIEQVLPSFVLKNLDSIFESTNKRVKQDEKKASYTRTRSPRDGEIDWNQPKEKLYNFIRAQSPPYPCAFSRIVDKNGNVRKLVIPHVELKGGRLLIEVLLVEFDE